MTVHLLGSGTERSQGRLGGFRKFNYAPTVAEAVSILSGGVPESLRGASEVPVYESDFSAGVDGWSGTAGGTVVGNVDGIYGENDALSITTNGSNASEGFRTISIPLNSRNRVRIMIAADMANVTVAGGRLRIGGPGEQAQDTAIIPSSKGVWQSFDFELSARTSGATRISVYTVNSANQTSNNTSGDKIYIKAVLLSRIGLTSQLSPESIQLAPGQWLDTSGNGKHAYIPDGFRLGRASRSGDLSSVLAWETSSTDPRYVTGVNASAVPANSAVTIYAKADASGTFDIGDGNSATYYASAVSIGTDWTPITLTSPVNDGTNRKIVLTPTSAYAGSVTISAQVQVLA